MTLLSILALATAIFVLAVTPGPGVLTILSKALSSGFRQTLPVILGIVLGDLIFLLFAIYGLAMVAETYSHLFILIRYLGAAYLVWLGIALWRSKPAASDIAIALPHSPLSSFLGGLSITLGNPKVILFYLGFLPTFLDLKVLSGLEVIVVALVVSGVLGSVMLFYAYGAAKTRLLFQNEDLQSRMHKTAGSIMIGAGILLFLRT